MGRMMKGPFAGCVVVTNRIGLFLRIKNLCVKICVEKMGLNEDFEDHAAKARTLPDTTTNENLLIIYGLYKQATIGDVNTSRPGIFNQRDRAKWDAWKANEGKSQDDAKSDYITKIKQLLEEAASG
ncbi:hypothetical protein M569_10959 [Genlisea aurea]|uniref:ACB domain-containing protein n=1 Tax=Genlisea aurea TaxID=192259 RepID=S8DLL3_9LAMI|nr:hypothetical protein M569_10959 [Genlisea aurea]